MKQTILKLALFLFAGNLLLISCQKKDELIKPFPQTPPPALSQYFQLTMDSLPGEPVAPVSNVFALVNIINTVNDTVLTNKKLPVSFQDGKFKTQKVALPAGDYRVSQFLIVNGDNQVRSATPVINSFKATMVSKPLPLAFTLPKELVVSVPIEIIKVEATDTPESFGYPAGLFNQVTDSNSNQNDFQIKMRLAVQVGNILYDSLPGTVLYSSWDENQQQQSKYITLTAFTNDITLSRAALKHHFRINKWGATYELTLLKNEIQDGALYTIGGTKEAKKLKQKLTYKLVAGTYVPEKKLAFNYQGDAKLSGIDHYLKNPDKSTYLAMREVFQYNNNSLEKINRYDQNNQQTGYTSFGYNATGKVHRITESANDVVTTATVDYFQAPDDITEVSFNYSYSNTSIGMQYYQRYYRGSILSDNSKTDVNSTETGMYDYDNQINPHAHLGWPDLFLSNESKSNRVWQQKSYYGNYPEAVAYEFKYTYDAEGYPVELFTHYKSYLTNTFQYTIKTVYTY